MHLKLHGTPLVLFAVNLAPLTFSSLEPLLALETAWRPSRPFLRQFGAPDVFFPRAPSCTWNYMVPLSSFSPSIWRHWRFFPWSPCLHLKLRGTPLVLISVNSAPLTFPSLEPLPAFETAWRPSRPFLRQFGAPDVFFPGAPACTWNCIWRPSRPFLRQFGAPDVFFPGTPACTWNCIWRPSRPFLRQFGAPDVFFPRAPACTWNCMVPPSSYWFNLLSFFFSFLLPLSSLFSFLFPSFPLFSSFFPSLFLSFSVFFFLFGAPLVTQGGPGPQRPPKIRPWGCA